MKPPSRSLLAAAALSVVATSALLLLADRFLPLAPPRAVPPTPAGKDGGAADRSGPAPAPAPVALEARSAAGEPLPGALVQLYGAGSADFHEATADAAGTARFDGVRPGQYTPFASKGNLVTNDPVPVVVKEGAPFTGALLLEEGARLRGSVTEAPGDSPVGGACLCLSGRPSVLGILSTETGPDGTFELAPLPRGTYALSVAREGFGTERIPRIAVGKDGPVTAVSVQLARRVPVAGTVVTKDGAPVEGAKVSLCQPGGPGAPKNKAKAGAPIVSFEDAELPAPLESPRLIPSGHLGVMKGPIPDFPLAPPAPGAAAYSAEGGAAQEEECPCAGRAAATPGGQAASSDAGGGFFLDVKAGAPFDLVVTHPDHAPRMVKGLKAQGPGPAAQLAVVLDEGNELKGRVTDAGGRPVAGAHLWVEQSDFGIMTQVPVEADGGFTAAHLAGEVLVSAHAEGYMTARRKLAAAKLAAGQEVLLVLASAEEKLFGRVVDPKGYPVEGAQVSARVEGEEGTGRKAASDADGSFSFTTLAPGKWRVVVAHRRYATAALTVDGWPEEGLELRLAPPGGVSGKVTDDRTYLPLAEFSVAFTAADGTETRAAFSGGEFALRDLPAGEGTLTVEAPGYAAASKSFCLPEGEDRDEITLADEDFWLAPIAQ